MKKITLIMITALFLNSCITFKTVPNFVSSKELAALTIGTSKAQVKINLGNTSPYDILLAGRKIAKYTNTNTKNLLTN